MEHWNNYFVIVNCSFFWLKTLSFYYLTLCLFVLWTSTFSFFYNWMISWSSYFSFRRKHWIQLFGSKIHNVGRLIQLKFDLPPKKVRCQVVEWTTQLTYSYLVDVNRLTLSEPTRWHVHTCRVRLSKSQLKTFGIRVSGAQKVLNKLFHLFTTLC